MQTEIGNWVQGAVMRLTGFALLLSSALCLAAHAVRSAAEANTEPPASEARLPSDWSEHVKLKDLTDELSQSASRMGQNLKKPADFDKYQKNINSEGHFVAILAALVMEHSEARGWKPVAVEIQSQGLAVAKAAEGKGVKNFRAAQDAHKKILALIKQGGRASDESDAEGDSTPTDWASLGDLADVMKGVDVAYKYIRGKMTSEGAFKKDADAIRHHAAILNTLTYIAPAFRPRDQEMLDLSAPMSTGSFAVLEAARDGDYTRAKEANAAINAACNDCHKAKRFQKKGGDLEL